MRKQRKERMKGETVRFGNGAWVCWIHLCLWRRPLIFFSLIKAPPPPPSPLLTIFFSSYFARFNHSNTRYTGHYISRPRPHLIKCPVCLRYIQKGPQLAYFIQSVECVDLLFKVLLNVYNLKLHHSITEWNERRKKNETGNIY